MTTIFTKFFFPYLFSFRKRRRKISILFIIFKLNIHFLQDKIKLRITNIYNNWFILQFAELLHPNELSSSMESLAAYDASVGSPGPVHQNQRTKRMRTSFKHHQLRTMKSYFAINQNPDAKDLKQLAQKTGLSKRVLQVI